MASVISGKGRKPASSNVSAILNVKRPTTPKEVKSYNGMLTFYQPYLPNLSNLIHPLRKAEQGNTLWWTPEYEEAFQRRVRETVIGRGTVIGIFEFKRLWLGNHVTWRDGDRRIA